MQTNATFNINKFCLFLSVIIEIINIFKTFSLALYFIISELMKIFKFMNIQLKKLMFYDCLNFTIIIKNFSKRLNAVMIECEDVKVIKKVSEDVKVAEVIKKDVRASEKVSEDVKLFFKTLVKTKKDCIL